MTGEDNRTRAWQASASPAARELSSAIDSGRTGDKVPFPNPAVSLLGTDDEAAGVADTPERVAAALGQELKTRSSEVPSNDAAASARRPRPVSPNIQIYRPQLTSVLPIANRITGVILSVGAIALVAWLIAAASGAQTYAAFQGAVASWPGQILLFGFTFAFFLHLCGGIRHLIWDTVHAFDVRSIYLGGWIVVAATVTLTIAAWVASAFV